MQANPETRSLVSRLLGLIRQPRVMLIILAVWSALAGASELFVNSGLFIDIHDVEVDGALGGFAFSFSAVPLAVLYLYCSRSPARYQHVFWLALIHQGMMTFGSVYHLVIGTFSLESVLIPLIGSAALAALSFAQIFETQPQSDGATT